MLPMTMPRQGLKKGRLLINFDERGALIVLATTIFLSYYICPIENVGMGS